MSSAVSQPLCRISVSLSMASCSAMSKLPFMVSTFHFSLFENTGVIPIAAEVPDIVLSCFAFHSL